MARKKSKKKSKKKAPTRHRVPPGIPGERLLTIGYVARVFDTDVGQIREWVDGQHFPSVRVDGKIRIPEKELNETFDKLGLSRHRYNTIDPVKWDRHGPEPRFWGPGGKPETEEIRPLPDDETENDMDVVFPSEVES